jgi:ferredoxin
MCEFCLQHGEGKKWYLNAKNYADDLLSDIERREVIKEYMNTTDGMRKQVKDLDLLERAPDFIKRVVRWYRVRNHKKLHFGQVVPMEDLEKIFEFVNSVVRVTCMCRDITNNADQRYCYGIAMGPTMGTWVEIFEGLDGSFLGGPEMKGMEEISKEDALANFRKYEKLGLCHTVWTFKTPFIGGICNCDRADCLAMKVVLSHEIPIMFRAEYVAENDHDLCKGCRKCMQVCQYGAIGYSAANKKSMIEPRACYGCGICRSMCKQDAIRLVDRRSVPVAANLWM